MSERQYDIVVFGATSFVGQILTARLVERIGTDGPRRWAIAGRSPDKLAAVANDTGATVPHIVADATDTAAMRSLAASTRTVISTVGPYGRYGSDLVAAVAATGTDYCDLAGEPHWMRQMIDAYQDDALASGARIVHACGFDSIPSDLGVWFTQQQAIERFGMPCTRIGLRVKAAKGGFSGGTAASAIDAFAQLRADPELRSVLGNPFALAPDGFRSGPRQPNVIRPQHDELSGRWVAPFVMAATNSKVVHRSHALLGRPWGDDFRYDEAMLTGDGVTGVITSAVATGVVAALTAAAAFGPTRALLRRVAPDPGEGPSPEQQQAGFFDLRLFGRTAAGDEITTRVAGDRDPGYGSTAKMLAETALAFDTVEPSGADGVPRSGFLTPTTAFGGALIDRLVEHAGLTFTVVDS